MRENTDSALCLGSMSEIANLSPYHFARTFRKITGSPPGEFLTAWRLERAKQLLLSTDLGVAEVCFEVGYESVGTFTTRFKELVGMPPRQSRGMANKAVSLLNSTANAELFDARLREVARRVAQDPGRIEYGARRRTLAGFDDIERGEWEAICQKAGTHPGKRGGRSRYAAAWLWCHLTGGDHRLSPWLRGNDSESARECYRRFVRQDLDQLRQPLIDYGLELLDSYLAPIDSYLDAMTAQQGTPLLDLHQ